MRVCGAPRCVAMASGSDGRVAITGATGLVGSRLVKRLLNEGRPISVLTRDKDRAMSTLGSFSRIGYFEKDDWVSGIDGAHAVVNLAGEPISTRWSDGVKKEIVSSRVGTTKYLKDTLNSLPEANRPDVLVSGSAIGYYGTSETKSFTEESGPGSDFLANVCVDWEQQALEAACKRTVRLRTGLVLAKEGGVLGKMQPLFQLFLGGPLGSGKQVMSWIHIDDLVEMILKSIDDDSFQGVLNGTAPAPVTMGGFCDTLASQLGRPNWLPVPDLALDVVLGEGAILVLEGQKVLPERAADLKGFSFQYPTLKQALKQAV